MARTGLVYARHSANLMSVPPSLPTIGELPMPLIRLVGVALIGVVAFIALFVTFIDALFDAMLDAEVDA